jgi:peptidoglycan/xylan/chitin deacetylase (PgdA/CDA1 family)
MRILMYHRIAEDPVDPLAISNRMFSQQMDLLHKKGYQGVPLGSVVPLLKGTRKKTRTRIVCLTFDDGYADFLQEAVPILQKYGFSATLFVVAGNIGGNSYWSSYRKDCSLLGWDELREILLKGHEIGSHTFSHSDMRKLSLSALRHEVKGSKTLLEEKLQVPIRHFAYPGGLYSGREIEAVKQAGYESAVSVGGHWGNGVDTPIHCLKREKMLKTDSLLEFWHKVYGFYELHWLTKKIS